MKKSFFLLACSLVITVAAGAPAPAETASLIARQFLSTDPICYKPEGFGGEGKFAQKGYGDNFNVHYSVVSLWVNAIECARKANDFSLVEDLVRHFDSFYWVNRQARCTFRHVDYNVFGALPAEIFLQNGDRRAYDMAVDYADRQWETPGPRDPQPWYDERPYEERLAWWEKGYSPQTRLWIDDMYMITFLQTQAYRITGDKVYLERASKEMALYLGKIQLENGLFHHSPEAPFAWARGNGWMAAGMTLLLEYLPKDDANRPQILAGYGKMMATLLANQRKDGLWGQLVDDPGSWDETSGSAMFAYAFQSGVNHGLLDAETYGKAARRAYEALVARLDKYANIADVCEGTGPKNSRDWYLGRGRVNGDPHGQAPLLWLCNALLDAELKCETNEVARVDYRKELANENAAFDGKVNSTNCWLKLRTPKGVKGFPTVVWFHGGGLTGGRPNYINLKDNGIAQAAVRYRFLTETDADGCIDDAAAAIAWIVKHIAEYGGDPSKVFVSGHSAGGYLTLMVGMDAKRLGKYGLKPTDLAGLIPVSGQVTKHFNVRKFSGDNDPQFLPKIDAYAPLEYCNAPSAPITFITGDRAIEFPCRVEENEFMATSMRKLGRTDVEFREFPRRTHVSVSGPANDVIRDFVRTHAGTGSCIAGKPIAQIRPHLAGTTKGGNWTIGCEVLDRELAKFAEYENFLPVLGINRIRLQGGWARCEKVKGQYDFSWLDEPVDFCRAHNIDVLLETSYGNPIYEGAGGWDLGGGFPKSEEGLAAWDRWVEAMAKHFKGRVRDWAMWNEPDLKGGNGRVAKTPEEIAAFNVRTAKIIKRIIPDARISALSLANNDPKLLEKCLKGMKDDLGLFDSAIYHGYSPNPDDSYDKVERQKKVLAKYAPHMQLRQGENGCPSSLCKAYALRNIPWNELSQAKWDVRRMMGDLGHDVGSSVFTIVDYTQANRPLNTKGLLAVDDRLRVAKVKPAFAAVRNLVSVFDSSRTRVRDSKVRLTGKRVVAYEYASPSGRVIAYWDASKRPDEALHHEAGELTLPGKPLKDPVLVDPLTGNVYDVIASCVTSRDGVVTYSKLPVYDYPWMLAERGALDLAVAGTVPDAAELMTMEKVKANFVNVIRKSGTDVREEVAKLDCNIRSGDAVVNAILALPETSREEVDRLVKTLRDDGTWPDVDYESSRRSRWPRSAHLVNIRILARLQDQTPEIEAACHKALGYWLSEHFTNPNWWWNQIGVPLELGSIALLMDGKLSQKERDGILMYMKESKIGMTGQNRVWLSESVLMRALFEGNVADAKAAREAIIGEITMSDTNEGIQDDWSFHQHGNMPQFGNYGAAYILTIPRLATVFAGTDWECPVEKLEILEKLVDRGFRPTVWRGSMDVGALGRQIMPNVQRFKGVSPLVSAAYLSLSGRDEAKRIFNDCLADCRSEKAVVSHDGLTVFPKSAMAYYRTDRWMAGVKCETKSIKGTELINDDNYLGAYLADGALFSYVTGEEYAKAFPLWNWRHIPGITTHDVESVAWKNAKGEWFPHNRAEIFEKVGANGVRFVLDRDGLKAGTEWKFSNDRIDVKVTGISSGSADPVVTTVEQSTAQPGAKWWREGDRIVAKNGAITYIVPSNAVVKIEKRTGSWHRHMLAQPDVPVNGEIFEITVPHGVRPTNASCSWQVRFGK